MATINKIEKYRLENRILALSAEGRTTHEIARIMTEELGGVDSLSQPTVSRFLKGCREERAAQTQEIVREHLKATVPVDLAALDEVEAWLLDQFRQKDFDVRTRADMGMRVIKVVETKLRYAGILENPDALPGDADIDLDQFRYPAALIGSAAQWNGLGEDSAVRAQGDGNGKDSTEEACE